MDAITRRTVQEHLSATVAWLQHANNVPAEHALPLLAEARDNLAAAIDTIEQARKVIDAAPARPRRDLTTLGRAESLQALAESHIADTRLAQLIHQAGHPA